MGKETTVTALFCLFLTLNYIYFPITAYRGLQQKFSLVVENELTFSFLHQSVSNFDLEGQLLLVVMLSH